MDRWMSGTGMSIGRGMPGLPNIWSARSHCTSLPLVNPRLRAIARTAVATVNHPVAKRRIISTLADAARPLKLEIGGTAKRPGWVVTNVSAVTRNYLDATAHRPPEDDRSEERRVGKGGGSTWKSRGSRSP